MPHFKKKPPLKLFETLVNQSPLGVFVWKIQDEKNINTCLNVFVNQKALKMLQIKKKEILGYAVEKAFPQVDRTKLPLLYQKLIKSGEAQYIPSFAYGDKIIEPAHFEVSLIPLNKNHLAVLFIDISSRVDVQNKLAEKVKELERLNEFMVGREIRMMELKKEIAQLKKGKKISKRKKK